MPGKKKKNIYSGSSSGPSSAINSSGSSSSTGKNKKIRVFTTGATRNLETGKNEYDGFLSPLVIEAFGDYMTKHRLQKDGSIRPSDNWQKGMPLRVYMSSGWRHFLDWWKEDRGFKSRDGLVDALCGLLFNVQGYLHEHLKNKLKLNKNK